MFINISASEALPVQFGPSANDCAAYFTFIHFWMAQME